MQSGEKTRGRGRPRKTLHEMVNQLDDDSIPYLNKTSERKRGRPRKTPQKTVNETDDDNNSSFPQKTVNETDDDNNSSFPKTTGRKRGRPRKTPQKTVNETDDEYNSSFPKTLGRKRGRPRKTPQKTVNETDDDYNSSFPKTSGRKRGRPRKTPQKTGNETDDDYNSSFPKTTGRKRGRPRKTPQKTVNATDDDYNSSFPKTTGRKRGRPRKTPQKMVNETDGEYNSSFPKTTGRKRGRPRKTPQKMVIEIDDNYNSSSPKVTGRKRGRPRKTPQKTMNETDDDYKPSFPKELSTDGPSHPVQDSGVAFKHPLHTDLVTYVRGKNGSSRHLKTPIDERMNLLETEDDLCCPTKGKTVAAEPTSESTLQEINVLSPMDENITMNSVSSDSSKSEYGSSVSRSNRSEGLLQSIVPMDSCEDNHLPQTQVIVVAKDAKETTSQSFNLTEVANQTLDDEDDIESSIDPTLVDIKGYRVRPEIARLLHQILEQHGDIAKDCKVKALQGCLLEKVCSFYEKLQKSSFQEIKRGELYEMVEALDELEHMGLNVKWLSERSFDILEVKVFLKTYAKKRKEFKDGIDQLDTLEKAAALIQQKMSVLETEISKMKAEEEKIQKVRNLLNNSLVDGLV